MSQMPIQLQTSWKTSIPDKIDKTLPFWNSKNFSFLIHSYISAVGLFLAGTPCSQKLFCFFAMRPGEDFAELLWAICQRKFERSFIRLHQCWHWIKLIRLTWQKCSTDMIIRLCFIFSKQATACFENVTRIPGQK